MSGRIQINVKMPLNSEVKIEVHTFDPFPEEDNNYDEFDFPPLDLDAEDKWDE